MRSNPQSTCDDANLRKDDVFTKKKEKKIRRTSTRKIEKQVQTLTGCGTEIKQRKEAKQEGV